MEILPLDASDPAALAAWHATYHAAYVLGVDHPAPRMLEEMRAELLGEKSGERREPWAGYVDGTLVCTGVVVLPQMDNLSTARVEIGTHPDHRRRGHGTAMLEHLTAIAVTQGRDLLTSEAAWAYDEPADGVGTTNADFATHHGFVFSLGDVKRALDLPVDPAVLERLGADAAPYHRDYALRGFHGPVPEDLIDAFGVLVGSLMTEAPVGDLDLEPEVFDAARIRSEEKVLEAGGRTKYTTVAIAPDGDLVAYSELAVPSYDPGRVYQWGTLVDPGHRGHRLGMATKVHNLRQLSRDLEGEAVMLTWNAEVNVHMIAVNDALGFRPVGRLGEFQKRLPAGQRLIPGRPPSGRGR